ncbi:LysR family transcriptional regulator [Holophaga foetida]|uniref:LysR family transcriptional regulator n=1 Tax=Holophaga foetida TaxID=35839 RepID=UPI0002471C79|nr:LysR family transcriptional regulator [Holophaga foetida]
MSMNLSLTQLRYFLAVADCLSYTEAARRLHISQPPLSKQVALLEAEMGLLLFRREHRGVTLTPAGAAFAAEVRALFAHLERSVAKAQELAQGAGGQIRLVIPEAMVLDPLQGLLRDFMDVHPGIQFQIIRLNLGKAREALLVGAADLLFTLSFEADSLGGCSSRLLGVRQGCWVISRQHPLAAKTVLEPPDFAELDLILVSREVSPGGYAAAVRNCGELGFRPRAVVEVASFDALLTYVELGHGIAIIGLPQAERNTDRFKAFAFPEGKGEVGLMLFWREEAVPPALRLFLDHLGREAWEEPPR